MKNLIIGFGLLFSGITLADNAAFQEHKANMLQDIEAKLSRITEHKTCITNATSGESLKACNENLKAWHEAKQKERVEKKLKKGKK